MLYGSDLSEWQKPPVTPRPGDRFWYIRVSDGAKHIDATYSDHLAQANRHNIVPGAYMFFRPAQDPKIQAALVAARSTAGMLPPCLDIEDFSTDSHTMAVRVTAALEELAARGHKRYVIYMSAGNVGRVAWEQVPARLRDGIIWWIASWGKRPATSYFGRPVLFWQEADKGGSGNSDADIFFGTSDELLTLAGRQLRKYYFQFLHGPWRLKATAALVKLRFPASRRQHMTLQRDHGGPGWVVAETYGAWTDKAVRDAKQAIIEKSFNAKARPFSVPAE